MLIRVLVWTPRHYTHYIALKQYLKLIYLSLAVAVVHGDDIGRHQTQVYANIILLCTLVRIQFLILLQLHCNSILASSSTVWFQNLHLHRSGHRPELFNFPPSVGVMKSFRVLFVILLVAFTLLHDDGLVEAARFSSRRRSGSSGTFYWILQNKYQYNKIL